MAIETKWKQFAVSYAAYIEEPAQQTEQEQRNSWHQLKSDTLLAVRGIIERASFSIGDLNGGRMVDFRFSDDNSSFSFGTDNDLDVDSEHQRLEELKAKIAGEKPACKISYGTGIEIKADSKNPIDFARDKTKLEALKISLTRTLGEINDPHMVVTHGNNEAPSLYIQIHHPDLAALNRAITAIKQAHQREIFEKAA